MTGIYDYLTLPISQRARKDATVHLVLNVALMVIFLISLLLKAPFAAGGLSIVPYGRTVTTFILDMIGIFLLATSGWYGGEIVYRHGVAVLEEAAAEIRRPAIGTTPVMGPLGGERPADPDADADDHIAGD